MYIMHGTLHRHSQDEAFRTLAAVGTLVAIEAQAGAGSCQAGASA